MYLRMAVGRDSEINGSNNPNTSRPNMGLFLLGYRNRIITAGCNTNCQRFRETRFPTYSIRRYYILWLYRVGGFGKLITAERLWDGGVGVWLKPADVPAVENNFASYLLNASRRKPSGTPTPTSPRLSHGNRTDTIN